MHLEQVLKGKITAMARIFTNHHHIAATAGGEADVGVRPARPPFVDLCGVCCGDRWPVPHPRMFGRVHTCGAQTGTTPVGSPSMDRKGANQGARR